jgi:nucleoside triphosphate pyrophosphatase
VSRPERLVLASASPRRRTLLAEAGFTFEVQVADVDEGLSGNPQPEAAAEELALRKALAVAGRMVGQDRLVIGADTVVALDGPSGVRLLGKPEGPGQARRMLAGLSGSRHRVVTGVAVIRTRDGEQRLAHERTWVSMRTISPREIEDYVASGEWRDKAGGYAIQENADAFVLGLEEGGFDNVVGLPVALTRRLLDSLN